MIPPARIVHQAPGRIRFRIPSKKGNHAYFEETARRIAETIEPDRVEANPATGSLLVLDDRLDLQGLLSAMESEGLFRMDAPVHPAPLARLAITPVTSLSERLRQATFGRIDLANLAFFVLVGVGTYQLIKGGLRSPPWYTAFWYAMGIYLKTLADKSADKTPG